MSSWKEGLIVAGVFLIGAAIVLGLTAWLYQESPVKPPPIIQSTSVAVLILAGLAIIAIIVLWYWSRE